MIYWFFETS